MALPTFKCDRCRNDKKKCTRSDQPSPKCQRCNDFNHHCSELYPPSEYNRIETIVLAPSEEARPQYNSATSMAPGMQSFGPSYTDTPRESAILGDSSWSTTNGLMPAGFITSGQGASFTSVVAGESRLYEAPSLLPLCYSPELEPSQQYMPSRNLAWEPVTPEHLQSRQENKTPINSFDFSDVETSNEFVAQDNCIEDSSSTDNNKIKNEESSASSR